MRRKRTYPYATVCFQIPKELNDRLNALSDKTHLPKTAIIEAALSKYLKVTKNKEEK